MAPTLQAAARSDSGLAGELRVSVLRLGRRLRNERDPDDDLGLGAKSVLGVLYRNGEKTIGELAAHEHVQPPSMTRTITCLVEAGLAVRKQDENDRRVVLVHLTDAGRARVLADRRRRDAWLSRRLRELTPEERALLRAAAPLIEKLATS